ncbi:serine hydrolase [Paenisporosarcina sp. TG20]|uniref:serine hydrolase n=1 Tax=Paenisporosarcina sp. TG20 TaxID=1211706 RepID=UPI0002FEFDFF|nr:serine hydrolase [Paenisporosarcina sp. TG20]
MGITKFPGKYSLHMEYPIGTVQYSLNIDEVFKSASLIKLPIFLYGFHHAKDLEELVEVSPEDIVDGAGVLQTLVTESRMFSVRDLLVLMMVVSDNTATNVLIGRYGLKRLNTYLQHLGMTKSKLAREMRDQVAILAGLENLVCSRDMVACLRILASSPAFRSMLYILENNQFKNKVPMGVKNEGFVFFNKTGELDNIEHDTGFFIYKGQIGLYVGLTEGSNTLGRTLLQEFGHMFDEL